MKDHAQNTEPTTNPPPFGTHLHVPLTPLATHTTYQFPHTSAANKISHTNPISMRTPSPFTNTRMITPKHHSDLTNTRRITPKHLSATLSQTPNFNTHEHNLPTSPSTRCDTNLTRDHIFSLSLSATLSQTPNFNTNEVRCKPGWPTL